MSSTLRGGKRLEHDYYRTDPKEAMKFLTAFRHELALQEQPLPMQILDPCAGGNLETITFNRPPKEKRDKKTGQKKLVEVPPLVFEPSRAAYPEAFNLIDDWRPEIITLDIREDADAQFRGVDFLKPEAVNLWGNTQIDAAISNPPFSLALEFVRRALAVVRENGYVIFLMRSAFMESEERNNFLRGYMPEWEFTHSKRMSFTPDGQTDSCMYSHYVWRVGHRPRYAKKVLLPYD